MDNGRCEFILGFFLNFESELKWFYFYYNTVCAIWRHVFLLKQILFHTEKHHGVSVMVVGIDSLYTLEYNSDFTSLLGRGRYLSVYICT